MSSQRTISQAGSLSGVGLHSGEQVQVTFKPAPVDNGIVFVRIDIEGHPSIAARPENLCKRMRRTALAQKDVEIHTPEHLMAAATGLGIDNLIVEIDGIELPGLDGSAVEFATCLRNAGIVTQDKAAKSFTITEPISVNMENTSIVALPYHNGLKITYTLDDHNGAFKGPMMVETEVTEESFSKDIAPARTFCLLQEVEYLRSQGLGKGANTTNTCVWDGEKLVDNEFRFVDEPARHKVLDLIGDLSHITSRINAHIIAVRSGHHTNMVLVKAINEAILKSEKPALHFDIQAIIERLPHRYPFLLVDRIIDFENDKSIVGLKNVTVNEPFFQGHFPNNPVMPGVLQIEAMAQTAAVLFMSMQGNERVIPFFMSIEKAKFRRPVVPGDQMIIEIEVLRHRKRMGACRGKVLVAGKVCAEAEIRCMLVEQ